MAFFNAAKVFFKKHPLISNCCIYGTLYVVIFIYLCLYMAIVMSFNQFLKGAEFSQQTITKKYLVSGIENLINFESNTWLIFGSIKH